MASSKKNKTIDNQESINKVEGSLNINESNKAIKKKSNIKKGVEEKKESFVGEKKSSIKGDSKKRNKVSGIKKSDEIKESSLIKGVVKKNKPKLGSNLADNKSSNKKVLKSKEKSTISGRVGKKVGSNSKVDSKKTRSKKKALKKKVKKHHVSKRETLKKKKKYQRVVTFFWKTIRHYGERLTPFNRKDIYSRLSNVYHSFLQLPLEEQEWNYSRRKVSSNSEENGELLDYLLIKGIYDDLYKRKLVDLPNYETWWSFDNSFTRSAEESEIKLIIDGDDSGGLGGGKFYFETTPSNVYKDIRDSGLWGYLSSDKGFRNIDKNTGSRFIDYTKFEYEDSDRDGNKSVIYRINNFIAGDGSIKETTFNPEEKSNVAEPPVTSSSSVTSEAIRLQELKNKEVLDLIELEKQKAINKELDFKLSESRRLREEKLFEALMEGKIDSAQFERMVNNIYK